MGYYKILNYSIAVVTSAAVATILTFMTPQPVYCVQGIKFLQTHHIIGDSEADVAEYLLKGELLNKRAIGDYLGEG